MRGSHRCHIPRWQGSGANRHVGHVERAGDPVEQAERDQEQRGADQVDDHILHARREALRALPMQHQAIGGDQQHFEEDEQIEQIASQECAIDTKQLELEEGVKVPSLTIKASQGRMSRHGKAEHSRQQQHQRRQSVQHQHDAEGRWPIAQRIGQGFARHRPRHKDKRQQDEPCRRANRDGRTDPTPTTTEQQRRGSRKCGQQQGGSDQRIDHGAASRSGWGGSASTIPST